MKSENIDLRTVDSFGDEWTRFDQSEMSEEEAEKIFNDYFSIFPWESLSNEAVGFDMGCGSGRWARLVAPRVGRLHCIDPSDAIEVARKKLAGLKNVEFHRASLHAPIISHNSQDFGYCLGVLHHVPNTASAIRSCVALLRSGAPLLLYLYYAFDNRPAWFRVTWRISDGVRRVVSHLPAGLKNAATDFIAATVCWPLARLSRALESLGFDVHGIPLSYYRKHSFYTMRTDTRDRFGTPLEKRFRRIEIETMMREAGLNEIRFSPGPPYWCAVGLKAG